MMPKKKKSPVSEAEQGNSQTSNTNNSIEERKKQDAKSREWWCVVYPESAPDNWRELVQETFLEAFISPLHDKDVLPDGTPKKAHYHVVLAWPGPTTYSNAKTVIQSFGGVIQPKVIGSLRGVCRYLCHLDNPDKAQYKIEDVVCFNGANYVDVINIQSDKYIAIEEMQVFCEKYKITSFNVLNRYAREHRHSDWYRCLCDNGAYVMREFLKSLNWELENFGHIVSIDEIHQLIAEVDEKELADSIQKIDVDPSTGEIIDL